MADARETYQSLVSRKHVARLLSELNSLRNLEEADVILTSGDVEFPVHKIVLKASCPYFKGMFNSKMKEATAEKVSLDDISPEALKVILDYLYLGTVAIMEREGLTTDVLKATHMLQLTDLFDYCCDHLMEWLNLSNFHEIWKLAQLYDLHDTIAQVQCYVLANITEAAFHPSFLNLTKEELKCLLIFGHDRRQITEDMLLGALNWLRHDLDNREGHAGEVFSYIDVKSVSREFMKHLLEYEERTSTSKEISNRLKDLAISVFYTLCEMLDEELEATNTSFNSDATIGLKLVYFSKHRLETCADSEKKCTEKCLVLCDTVQALDLHTMTWQPPRKLPFSIHEGAAMCQYGEDIYMVGGASASTYVCYNIATNVVNYVDCDHFNGKTNGFLFALGKFLFFVERSGDGLFTGITRINPGTDDCCQELQIQRPSAGWFSNVFATTLSFHIVYAFMCSGQAPSTVVYNYEISRLTGKLEMKSSNNIAYLPHGVKVSFALSGRDLFGLYHYNGHIERLHRDENTEHWITMPCNVTASNINEVNTVFKSSMDTSSVVFVSTEESNHLRIPNFIWKPETGAWFEQPPTKGKCIIPNDPTTQKVYFVK